MQGYSEQITAHFEQPQNVGQLPDADGVGDQGDHTCGDFLKVWIKVRGDHITEIRFQCRGCPAAIATASIMTELAKGKTLAQAEQITAEDICLAAGGLPPGKQHCSNLAAQALQQAISHYRSSHPEPS